MDFMKSLVYEGPKIMNIRQSPIPEPKENELLIRVERAGICGSELSGYLGHNSLRKPPLIMGHEFSGTVVKTGEKATAFQQGDRVTANPLVSCGTCRQCRNGAAQLCPARSLVGAHRPGAFAEYVAVPADSAYILPDHVSFDQGAFTEPFACAVHICRLLQLTPTDRLLIVGAGPIGLLTLQAAKLFGLQNIVMMDINQERVDIGAKLGAVTVTRQEQLSELSAAGFDAAVDAVGISATRKLCVESVTPGGRVAFSGLHEAESSLPINLAIRNEVLMFGAFAYAPDDFETALQWISEDRINLLPWTVHAPLEEGGASFEKLITGPGHIAKILLTI
jgi:2-desacetyl-2-hydroxyethyl bacteriochlorophyllide A dehydrogenase